MVVSWQFGHWYLAVAWKVGRWYFALGAWSSMFGEGVLGDNFIKSGGVLSVSTIGDLGFSMTVRVRFDVNGWK